MNHVSISKMGKCEIQACQVTQLIDSKSACNYDPLLFRMILTNALAPMVLLETPGNHIYISPFIWAGGGDGECSVVAQPVKNPPAMQETLV